MKFEFVEPVSDTDFQQYYDLRYRVLRQGWGQPVGSERDELESVAYHLSGRLPDRSIIACGRLHLEDANAGRIRYMAVEPAYQGNGLGSRMLHKLEIQALKFGCRNIRLSARDTCTGFYSHRGYTLVGRGPLMFGQIPHSAMEKMLTADG